eukprot:6195036-Pleurochrysis_carterae.AAC.3
MSQSPYRPPPGSLALWPSSILAANLPVPTYLPLRACLSKCRPATCSHAPPKICFSARLPVSLPLPRVFSCSLPRPALPNFSPSPSLPLVTSPLSLCSSSPVLPFNSQPAPSASTSALLSPLPLRCVVPCPPRPPSMRVRTAGWTR